MSILARSVIGLVRLYQRTLSPDHGLVRPFFPHGVCKFTPTCSEYMIGAVTKYGVSRGVYRGIRRILRCGPSGLPDIDYP